MAAWKPLLTMQELRDYVARRIVVEDGHQIWQLGFDRNGFPRGTDGVVTRGAHRMAWEAHHGRRLPRTTLVLMLCGVAGCVDPAHAVLSTAYPSTLKHARKDTPGVAGSV